MGKNVKGTLIIIPSIFIAIVELYLLIITPFIDDNNVSLSNRQYWAIAIPIFFLTFSFSLILVWIGYTMIVTKEPMRLSYDSAYEETAGDLSLTQKNT